MDLSLDSGGGGREKKSPQLQHQQPLHPSQLPRQQPQQPHVITISAAGHTVGVHHGSSTSVIREQYCSCKPQTKMETIMMVVIVAMGFIIVALVAALSAVAKAGCDPKLPHNNVLF